jgi:hypothetical protein
MIKALFPIAAVLAAGAAHAQVLDMTWKPVRDAGGEVSAIEVTQVVNGVAGDKPFGLNAPVTYAAVTGVADRITGLKVTDRDGEISFTVSEDKPVSGGFPYYRHWTATRAVSYPVTVSYSAQVQPPNSPGGPAFGIRPSGGGVSGSGGGFLMLPENAGTTTSKVRWDLSGLEAGSVGVTTFGQGAFEVKGAPQALTGGWLMAGPAQHYSIPGDSHFNAYWLGALPFDAKAEMVWASKAYKVLSTSFKYMDPAPDYRVFLRGLKTPPFGGGTALGNSFMYSMSEAAKKDIHDIRITVFHEMGHQWVGGIEGGVADNWFTEGLNVYYTTILPLRGGLVSVDEYAALLNEQVANYYTSPARNWSAEKIVGVGFGDEKIRHTPYVRGALYWADLDVKIRENSKGKRNLDSFLAPMFAARHKGARFDRAYFEAMLSAELGPKAVDDFRAINIDGTQTIDPSPKAFGPCFTRKATQSPGKDAGVDGFQYIRLKTVANKKCAHW